MPPPFSARPLIVVSLGFGGENVNAHSGEAAMLFRRGVGAIRPHNARRFGSVRLASSRGRSQKSRERIHHWHAWLASSPLILDNAGRTFRQTRSPVCHLPKNACRVVSPLF